jgi:hypothetical protein
MKVERWEALMAEAWLAKHPEDKARWSAGALEELARCAHGIPRGLPRGPRPYRRGLLTRRAKLEPLLRRLFEEGLCNRAVQRATGMHVDTVAKWRKRLEREQGGVYLCKCGRRATHRGWCAHRLRQSPGRRAFLARWRGAHAS